MNGGKAKRPWLAVVLSALIPGLGQLYNGAVGKSFMLLSLNFLIAFLNKDLVKAAMEKRVAEDEKWIFLAYTFVHFLLTVFAMVDAKIGAERVNKKLRSDG